MNANAASIRDPDPATSAERRGQTVVLPGQTPDGQYVLSVLLKRTYDIVPGQTCVRSEYDRKLISGDVHYDGPMNSAVQFESDFVPFKVATDVVVNGIAYAPGGEPATELVATVIVGAQRKDVQIIGDRVSRYRRFGDPLFTDPEPFESMPLRYERAYGGVDVRSDPKVPCLYGRNHLGRGFVIGDGRKIIDGLALPNIEDPDDLLTPGRLCTGHFKDWERQPMPQGFGWFAKFWQPRATLAGVLPADRPFEQELRQVYAKAIPAAQRALYEQTGLPDMDFRFFSGASAGLVLPYLAGREAIRLLHLDPGGETIFELPGDEPRIGLDVGIGEQVPVVVIQTVMIRVEDRQVDLVWRGAVPYPGPDWLPEMKRMEVVVQ